MTPPSRLHNQAPQHEESRPQGPRLHAPRCEATTRTAAALHLRSEVGLELLMQYYLVPTAAVPTSGMNEVNRRSDDLVEHAVLRFLKDFGWILWDNHPALRTHLTESDPRDRDGWGTISVDYGPAYFGHGMMSPRAIEQFQASHGGLLPNDNQRWLGGRLGVILQEYAIQLLGLWPVEPLTRETIDELYAMLLPPEQLAERSRVIVGIRSTLFNPRSLIPTNNYPPSGDFLAILHLRIDEKTCHAVHQLMAHYCATAESSLGTEAAAMITPYSNKDAAERATYDYLTACGSRIWPQEQGRRAHLLPASAHTRNYWGCSEGDGRPIYAIHGTVTAREAAGYGGQAPYTVPNGCQRVSGSLLGRVVLAHITWLRDRWRPNLLSAEQSLRHLSTILTTSLPDARVLIAPRPNLDLLRTDLVQQHEIPANSRADPIPNQPINLASNPSPLSSPITTTPTAGNDKNNRPTSVASASRGRGGVRKVGQPVHSRTSSTTSATRVEAATTEAVRQATLITPDVRRYSSGPIYLDFQNGDYSPTTPVSAISAMHITSNPTTSGFPTTAISAPTSAPTTAARTSSDLPATLVWPTTSLPATRVGFEGLSCPSCSERFCDTVALRVHMEEKHH